MYQAWALSRGGVAGGAGEGPPAPGGYFGAHDGGGIQTSHGVLQTKLVVGHSDDPLEEEADRVADAVLRMRNPATGGERPNVTSAGDGHVRRQCERCEDDDEQRVHRRAELEGAGSETEAPMAVEATLRSNGWRPLDAATRAYFEPRFGHGFGHVRVYDGAQADASARAVGARAYTVGSNVVFRGGQYAPGTKDGRGLLAHELAHVMQQMNGATAGTAPFHRVQREGMEYGEEYRWGLERRQSHRAFMQDLGRVPSRSLAIEQSLAHAVAPTTDEERDRLDETLQNLVRLNALGMMASHRAHIEGTQQRVETGTTDEASTSSSRGIGARSTGGSTVGATLRPHPMAAVRSAATVLDRLLRVRTELEDAQSDLHIVSTNALLDNRGDLNSWIEAMIHDTQDYRAPWVRQNLLDLIDLVRRSDRNSSRGFVSVVAGNLSTWRARQVEAVKQALGLMYDKFPMFTQLEPAEVVAGRFTSDVSLQAAVRQAYADLLRKVDDGIEEIATEDIHPFDLPEAVRYTRGNLPEALRPELDRAMSHHEAVRFWTTLGLTMLQAALVFVPVVGPALAAAIGAVALGVELEEVLDRYGLSAASTDVDGTMLGVDGPSSLDWTLLAINAIFTAIDLGAVMHGLGATASAERLLAQSERIGGEEMAHGAGAAEGTLANRSPRGGEPSGAVPREGEPVGARRGGAARSEIVGEGGPPPVEHSPASHETSPSVSAEPAPLEASVRGVRPDTPTAEGVPHSEVVPARTRRFTRVRTATGETHEIAILPDGRCVRCSRRCLEISRSVRERMARLALAFERGDGLRAEAIALVEEGRALRQEAHQVAQRPEVERAALEMRIEERALDLEQRAAALESRVQTTLRTQTHGRLDAMQQYLRAHPEINGEFVTSVREARQAYERAVESSLDAVGDPDLAAIAAEDMARAARRVRNLDGEMRSALSGRFDADQFYEHIRTLSTNERVAAVRRTAGEIAEGRGWERDARLSAINDRVVYRDPDTGKLYALDTQHGTFERCNANGVHEGEFNFNFDQIEPADRTGRHDLNLDH